MLRELITWVLNTYLGKYLEDFNPAQLTVALLSGEVELENVPLRKNALDDLGLPLQLLSGNVGKIKLQVPVRQFRTAPWCIIIENIYIIIGPKNLDNWNDDNERKSNLDYKLSQLDKLDAKLRAQNDDKLFEYSTTATATTTTGPTTAATTTAAEAGSPTNTTNGNANNANNNNSNYYATSYTKWLNYGSGLATNIIENLQLKINNIHIRYEDKLTINNYNFSFGIKIDTISAQSCDSNWLPIYQRNTSTQSSFKLLELHSLTLYWDHLKNNQEYFSDLSSNELAQAMENINYKNYHFIINPITAQAHFKRDTSETPLRTRSRPRLSCEILVNEIHLSLSDFQYTKMIECYRGLEEIDKHRKYRLLRPQQSIKDNPKEWWKYVLNCYGYKFKSYNEKMTKMHNNLKYLRLCKCLIQNPNENLTQDDKQFKNNFEMLNDLNELKMLHEISFKIIPNQQKFKLKQKENDSSDGNGGAGGRSMLFYWFPQWWGWYGQTSINSENSTGGNDSGNIDAIESVINNDETSLEDDILNALEDTVDENNDSILKRDVVFGKFEFKLNNGLLDICSENYKSQKYKLMLQMNFDKLVASIEIRPRSGSHMIDMKLGSVCVKDLITTNTEFPYLIKPQIKDDTLSVSSNLLRYQNQKMKKDSPQQQQTSNGTNELSSGNSLSVEPWFQLQYEKKPLAYNTDYRLVIKTRSLDVVYNIEPLKWLIDFITKPLLIESSTNKLEAMKYTTKMKIIKNWKNILDGDVGQQQQQRKSWSLEIDVSAPQIIFVENFCNKNTSILLVDFGRFQLLKNATQQCIRQQKDLNKNTKISQANVAAVEDTITMMSPTTVETTTSALYLMHRDSEDEDAFMTPCSTPPGSEISISDSPTMRSLYTDPPTLIEDNHNQNSLNQNSMIINNDTGLENALRDKIYDKYTIDLTDLQVLVCKGKERWAWASNKGTSPLHVLDRFNISLNLERRVVHTNDPEYPSLTLYGTLPKLVAHVNENKIAAINDILDIISLRANRSSSTNLKNDYDDNENDSITSKSTTTIPTANTKEYKNDKNDDNQPDTSESSSNHDQLILLQFVIDQMSLELQSRGRSIAELQVSGVRAGFTKRPYETNISLSVHGLLLADAIQSFGPDFELLVASHRHVGMDSVSGSLRQSEPCSPLSPASPDPTLDKRPTSPQTISKALNSLQRVNSATWSHLDDLDALITIDINLITPKTDGDDNISERLQIANIHFNNLDIIANQETIVELLDFMNRIFPSATKKFQRNDSCYYQDTDKSESMTSRQQEEQQSKDSTPTIRTASNHENYHKEQSKTVPPPASPTTTTTTTTMPTIRTEITFDFNRLNVLVLRALMRDQFLVGRKVGTFTMCEAKIHATYINDNDISVDGSLGGLQILDLTPDGINHQRILSVGKDPLTETSELLNNAGNNGNDLLNSLTQEIYGKNNNKTKYLTHMISNDEFKRALTFKITRNLQAVVNIKIRMASVWYTNCARFIQELSWCANEFKHYLKNIAKSIREKATDMAIGLVQLVDDTQDVDSTTTTATLNQKQTTSMSTSKLSYSSLKKRKKASKKAVVKLDIILDTPVLVLPRSSCSSQVLVAHLGKISINNFQNKQQQNKSLPQKQFSTSFDEYEMFSIDEEDFLNSSEQQQQQQNVYISENYDNYSIDIRNMNLFSLDTNNRKGLHLSSALPRAEEFYSCQTDAVAILHDTAIRLDINKFLNDFDIMHSYDADDNNTVHIHGIVTQPLQMSLTRAQYEQLLDTIDNIFKIPNDLIRPSTDVGHHLIIDDNSPSPFNLTKTTTGPEAFNFDNKIKSDSQQQQQNHQPNQQSNNFEPKVSFTLPMFIIQLKNEHNNPHIEITFREFSFNYEKSNRYETHIQVSLRSILMEDLLCPIDSKYRQMVISSSTSQDTAGLNNNDDRGCRSAKSNDHSSNSCPDLVRLQSYNEIISGSLPENLEYRAGFDRMPTSTTTQLKSRNFQHSTTLTSSSLCPNTPPPSPQPKIQEDNLVIYSSLIIDPNCPGLKTQYKGFRQTSSIDFNCLDLIISVERWYLLLNFFGLMSEDDDNDDNQKLHTKHEETTIREQTSDNSELEITVRSLNLVLVRNESELAKANVSNAFFVISKCDTVKIIEGRLGSVSLIDSTEYGTIYHERFLTSGSEALHFIYRRDNEKNNQRTLNKDAKLKIQMSSVKYVHTKRFIMEIQMFIKEFLQLQTPVMRKIKSSSVDSKYYLNQRPTQLGLEINADSPIILLPLSYNSNQVIVVDLGEFTLENSFHLSSESDYVISKCKKSNEKILDEILNIMHINLVNTNFLTGIRYTKYDNNHINNLHDDMTTVCLDMGNYLIKKIGKNLLKDKCHLKLQIEYNMDSWKSHNCPDISVKGVLSKLDAVLDIEQYKLIRGFLSYNLGEDINDVYSNINSLNLNESYNNLNLNTTEIDKSCDELIWTMISINFDLENVSLKLNWLTSGTPTTTTTNDDNFTKNSLACINFIKSSLKIDLFSDGSQDIDLVSQEILIMDSRYQQQHDDDDLLNLSNNNLIIQKNVFTNILQPIRYINDKNNDKNLVQAEIHSRRRNDNNKFIILLNNMRLMAIIDWIENIQDYLSQNAEPPLSTPLIRNYTNNELSDSNATLNQLDTVPPMEIILNITDSELVFVEKTDQLDTNAIILKSTTVVSFKQAEILKPVSINLNHLEVFSCVLGSEEETALSIIDPITINLDVKDHVLEIQIQKQFCIRLSYHDVKMFTRMLHSLPKQTRTAQTTSTSPLQKEYHADNNSSAVKKLSALGFQTSDCIRALQICNNQLDEAALWLTQNREPIRYHHPTNANATITNLNNTKRSDNNNKSLEILAVAIRAQCISICVIDDCKDADVPLLELSLSQIDFKQEISRNLFSSYETYNYATPATNLITTSFYSGHLKAILASDYYNRNLSGWEPVIEPWECNSTWNYSIGQTGNEKTRLNLTISSEKLLNVNVTSTLVELWKIVQANWTQDYYEGTNVTNTNTNSVQSPTGYKRRTPFVPFSLKNNTGEDLVFKILLTKPGGITRTEISRAGDIESRWIHVKSNEIVTFSFGQQNKFRHLDSHKLNLHQILVHVNGWSQVGPVSVDRVGIFFRHARRESAKFSHMPKTRIVFAVTLEGSAQKLVTVRSALRLINRLEDVLLLKMDYPIDHLDIPDWPDAQEEIIRPDEIYNVPLSHVNAHLSFKPLPSVLTTLVEDKIKNNDNNGKDTKETFQLNENDYWQKQNISRRFGNGSDDRFQFCDKPIYWYDSTDINGNDICQEQRACRGSRNKVYNVLVSIRKDGYPHREGTYMPGHTIVLLPPLRINNLLCCDLLYKLPSHPHCRIQPSEIAKIYEVSLDEPVTLSLSLDGYNVSGQLTIPVGHFGTAEPKLRLTDVYLRDLYLRASIQSLKGSGMEISVSAPFWLVNKTGLPLVFRQEGVAHEASGQFDEHEKARVVSPLMFSFSDPDASPALEIRLGNRFGSNPPWCQSLSMHKEVVHRQLRSGNSNETFVVGVEIRRGRGRYSRTSVVTFSPRFQLYNRSTHKLQFAQKCFVLKPLDSEARATIIDAVPGCHFPFHWPRSDHDPLLCVRLPEFEGCCWSSGIPINEVQSLYINVRNERGEMRFLRLEVILQGATYFLLFGDANTLPPPIRIDNHSEVPIKFFQYECTPEWRTTVKPHSTISYALDDPMGRQCLQIEAPDGDSFVCNLRDLNMFHTLTYSNFIYIAFKGTFQSPSIPDSLHMSSEFDLESQHLVLGVKDRRVILMRKCAGDRSQLWLMNPMQQLEHEGSGAPIDPRRKSTPHINPRLVLDLEKAPNPNDFTSLIVRPANKQRESTQTWKFSNDRLMCGHANMCVQARNGVFGLRPGSDAVLGRVDSGSHMRSDTFVPIEQQIERQKLRPGSGQLEVKIRMDGPIKTIQIRDVNSVNDSLPLAPDPQWKHASHMITSSLQEGHNFVGNQQSGLVDEYCIKLNLAGLGTSIISKRPCEELAYVTLQKIQLEAVATPFVRSIDLNIGDMQIDNQLLETPCPILLYMPKGINNNNTQDTSPSLMCNGPAIAFNSKMLPSPNANAVIFERFILSFRPFVLYLEERLILRMASFFELGTTQQHAASLVDESEYEAQQVTTKILAANAKRYYFENLLLSPCQIRLSVITASKLSPQLNVIKKKLGLTLVRFEDAVIDFDRFTDKHHFETLEIYLRAIKSHYKKQIKWHFGQILGSLDVFGNPLGLASDVTEGVSGFIFEGSVKSLVANVTHGFSNTAAKITETLSDGLGKVVLDEQDTEARQKILEVATTGPSSSKEHMTAALKGLGFGVLGGFTSIAKHTYEGTQSDGFQGFISGLGKGIVGTVTKPIIGLLDFASESANALRETSKSANRILPERKRLPRCISGSPGGLLPPYSFTQSKGQQHLYIINKRNFNEQLMSYEPNLCEDQNSRFRLLISTEYVRILSRTEDGDNSTILSFHLKEVLSCHPVTVNKSTTQETNHHHKNKRPLCYIEISSSSPNQLKRPRVRCQNEEMAEKATRHINYAKSVFDEREHTLSYDSLLDNTT